MIGSDLLRFQKNQVYIAKDWETESLNLRFARPWQLSYTVFNLKEILDKQTFYIWYEDLKVSAGAARITGFDYNEYKKLALKPEDVVPLIDKYIYDPTIITSSYNLFHYDSYIHQNARRSIGLKDDFSYLERSIDAWALAKAFKNGIKVD